MTGIRELDSEPDFDFGRLVVVCSRSKFGFICERSEVGIHSRITRISCLVTGTADTTPMQGRFTQLCGPLSRTRKASNVAIRSLKSFYIAQREGLKHYFARNTVKHIQTYNYLNHTSRFSRVNCKRVTFHGFN